MVEGLLRIYSLIGIHIQHFLQEVEEIFRSIRNQSLQPNSCDLLDVLVQST
jgi:hypothetical protein